MTDADFERDMIDYLTARGYRVTKARALRTMTATARRRLRKDHPMMHRPESVDGCPLCAFRADALAHTRHTVRVAICRFCTYEDRPRIFPSTLRRLPEQARYNRAFRTWRRARRRYGAGTVNQYANGRVTISGHPRVAHLQALLDRLSNPKAVAA